MLHSVAPLVLWAHPPGQYHLSDATPRLLIIGQENASKWCRQGVSIGPQGPSLEARGKRNGGQAPEEGTTNCTTAFPVRLCTTTVSGPGPGAGRVYFENGQRAWLFLWWDVGIDVGRLGETFPQEIISTTSKEGGMVMACCQAHYWAEELGTP